MKNDYLKIVMIKRKIIIKYNLNFITHSPKCDSKKEKNIIYLHTHYISILKF